MKKTMTIDEMLNRLSLEGQAVSLSDLAPLLQNLGVDDASLARPLPEAIVKKLGKYYGVDFLKKPVPREALVMPVILPKEEAPAPLPLPPAVEPGPEVAVAPAKTIALSGRVVARIMAMMVLVQEDLRGITVDEDAFALFFAQEDEKSYPVSLPFYHEILAGVRGHLREINTIVAFNLRNYTFDRLSSVDRAIVRIATWEMAFAKTDKRVVIDTALNITREYADIDDKQVAFNNSLLDSIAHYLARGTA